jgi:hypothetical protein
MFRYLPVVAAVLMAASTNAHALVFRYDTDPFEGSTALTTPGRQVVGGESFIDFNIAADLFSLESTAFGVGGPVLFANGLAENLPTGNVNVIVLQSFDNDANPATPFGAGNAANLIADRITQQGAGFFVYFNQGLDLPRLVYSTDLSDNTSDLKILFRMTNLTGQNGRDAIPTFTASNFEITTAPVPEPSTALLLAPVFALGAGCRAWRRRRGRG